MTAADKVGGIVLFVDAKDNEAAAFYRKYGFQPLPGLERQLMMPLQKVKAALALFGQ